jgi:hypothetical protein
MYVHNVIFHLGLLSDLFLLLSILRYLDSSVAHLGAELLDARATETPIFDFAFESTLVSFATAFGG